MSMTEIEPHDVGMASIEHPHRPVGLFCIRVPDTSFFTKLKALQKKCNYFEKDGVNTFHRYKYASASGVIADVSEAMQELGLTSWVETTVTELRERVTQKGGQEFVAVVELLLFLVDVETGRGIMVKAAGSGMDPGDKAVMKAQTAAIKYAWMLGLNSSTGDDPEADEETDRRIANTPKAKPEARGAYKGGATRSNQAADQPGYGDALLEMQEAHKHCTCNAAMQVGFHATKKLFYFNCTRVAQLYRDATSEEEKAAAAVEAKKHTFRWAKTKPRLPVEQPGPPDDYYPQG